MTLKTIYIARHGYRANWLPLPHPPNPTGIDSDPPLAPHGVEQAKELAQHISTFTEEEKPRFIISSPFYRCVETAQPTAKALGVPVFLERGVGEWYDKNRDSFPIPANYDDLRRFFAVLGDEKEWSRDGSVGVIPNTRGETPEEIFERAKTFWDKFFVVFEQKYPHIESILIFTHAATKIALGTSLLKKKSVYEPIDDKNTLLKAGACSLDKYTKSNDSWNLDQNGDCSFLSKGEEMNWDFYSKFEAGSDEDIKARKEAEMLKNSNSSNGDESYDRLEDQKPQTEEEYTDFYVTVDLPSVVRNHSFEESSDTSMSKNSLIKPLSSFQITNIDEDKILLKLSTNSATLSSETNSGESVGNINVIDGNIYEAKWKNLVGTDLIYDDYGELIAKVGEHLSCDENVKLVAKDSDKSLDKEEEEEEVESKLGKEEKTNFLKKAISYSKKRNDQPL